MTFHVLDQLVGGALQVLLEAGLKVEHLLLTGDLLKVQAGFLLSPRMVVHMTHSLLKLPLDVCLTLRADARNEFFTLILGDAHAVGGPGGL